MPYLIFSGISQYVTVALLIRSRFFYRSYSKQTLSTGKLLRSSAESTANIISLATQSNTNVQVNRQLISEKPLSSQFGAVLSLAPLMTPDAMLPPPEAYPLLEPAQPIPESKADLAGENSWEELQAYKPNIILVGGGPSGLRLAIKLKEVFKDINVLVLERYREYTRKHHLQFHERKVNDEILKAKFIAKGKYNPKTGIIKIHIPKLENCLIERARELGVDIGYKKFTSKAELEAAFPECHNFIGSDGVNSTVRKDVFGPDETMLVVHPMQKLFQISYVTEGKVDKLDTKKLILPEIFSDFLFAEDVHYNEETNTSTVTGRFFLDEETFKNIPDANLKNPGRLSNKLPLNIQEVLSLWLNTRGKEAFLGEPLYTKIILNSYHSKEFCKRENGHVWMVFGDAAEGFPFFDSFSNALVCANKVPGLMGNHFNNPHTANQPLSNWFMVQYTTFMNLKFAERLAVATSKDIGIDSSKVLLNSSAVMSLPFSSFSRKQDRMQLHSVFAETLLVEEKKAKTTVCLSDNRLSIHSSRQSPKAVTLAADDTPVQMRDERSLKL
jgi:hypothetical protein